MNLLEYSKIGKLGDVIECNVPGHVQLVLGVLEGKWVHVVWIGEWDTFDRRSAQSKDHSRYITNMSLEVTKLINKDSKKKMKHYRVIKENFLWEVGAILKPTSSNDGYEPIDDIYKFHEGNEYISSKIIENSPGYFERVYKVDLVTRVVYETKDKAKELMAKAYKA